jgi:hydrogenase maturation protein HypF
MSVDGHEARRYLIGGRVQGVGYRGFVYNLAQRFCLQGFVQNLTGEVLIEAQGDASVLNAFADALILEAPPLARPYLVSCEPVLRLELNHFTILPSASTLHGNIHISPDYFLCNDCRLEMQDVMDRRYRYPFINCTQCGPRYTLITAMPYDRPSTTMANFVLCEACLTDYSDPANRRFHAQPLACPVCGPQLNFISPLENTSGDDALLSCIAALLRGEIVAVKGIGGYHLLCDALNATAISRLRLYKHRPHKPLALMFPRQGADGLQCVRETLVLDAISAAALTDAARPIVLLTRRTTSVLPDSIAPGLNEIGAMLPYSPLHHLLLDGFGSALIATSGNISGEPVLTDNAEVEARLCKITPFFLHHNRPIARPADDSVLRVIASRPRLLRVGRGIAPLEFDVPFRFAHPVLALGGHMKNAVALGWDKRMVLSPHIGDLETPRSMAVFEQTIHDLQKLYGVTAQFVVVDAHSGYASREARLPTQRVYHHLAHASALTFEYGLEKTWLVFTWDGAGMGQDGTLWGGEALHGSPGKWRRAATIKSFRLPGGERASREPWRSAAALCWEAGLDWHSDARDTMLLKRAWGQGLNAPVTTSVGRLFDAAASLLGLCDTASFEGQGPMLLEAASCGNAKAINLPLYNDESGLLTADWTPLLHALMLNEIAVPLRAMQFHQSLAQSIVDQAMCIHAKTPFDAIGLTGGVFQNKLLAELACDLLMKAGFSVHLPEQAPCNDGGLALGQLIEAHYG